MPGPRNSEDPSVSSEQRRSKFLRSYKIKKKSQADEEAQVSSTIHVDPSRVHQVLPMVAASSPRTTTQTSSRPSSSSGGKASRDPRLVTDAASTSSSSSRDPRLGAEGGSTRDPRIGADGSSSSVGGSGSGVGSRDPRLGVSRPSTNTSTSIPPQTTKSNRDPRVISGKEGEGNKDAKDDKRDKDKDKKEKEEKKREHHKSKKEPSLASLSLSSSSSSRSSSQERKKRDSKDAKDSLSKPKSKSSRSDMKGPSPYTPTAISSSSMSSSSVSSTPPVTKPESNSNNNSSGVSNSKKKSVSPAPPKTPPKTLPTTTTLPTTFRSSRRGHHNRKYKPRDATPDSDNEANAGKDRESKTAVAGGKKTNLDEAGSDSDSDHYQGNRPSPELYNNAGKKVELSSGSSPASSATVSDTDYRQFTTPPKPTDDTISSTKKECVIDELHTDSHQGLGLFSKEDVDYRQLLPQPGRLPTPVGGGGGGGGGLPAAFKIGDQDERNLDPQKTPHDSQEPNTPPSRVKGVVVDVGEGMDSASQAFLDPRGRKNSFNSPHAASWEKFRAKNPEFEKYQRQASMSESHEEEEAQFNQQRPSDRTMHFRGYIDQGNGTPQRNREGWRPHCEKEEVQGIPGRSQASMENFKMILKQAMEQRDCGEMSEMQYQHMTNKLRMLTEQEQIREAKERERQRQQQQHHPLHQKQQLFKDNDGEWSNESSGNLPPSHPGRGIGRERGEPPGGSFAVRGGRGAGFMPPNIHMTRGNIGDRGGGRGRAMDEVDRWGRDGRDGGRGGGWGGGPSNSRKGVVGRGGGGGVGGGVGGVGGGFIQDWGGRDAIMEDEFTGEADLPYVSEETLKVVAREAETRTIEIDSVPREIRVYGQTAVVLLEWNDPRIIAFGDGRCNVVFDGGEFVLPMRIGEDYQEFSIAGETHRVKLGVPTQELMLDGRGYQCFFGGKPVSVHLAGQTRTVSLDGKPPNVNIGPVSNTEFLAGKVQLVINAKKVVNLFLDAKPQRFNIDGKPFVLRFVDALRAVTINNVRFPVEFGGLPISISVRGYRRFLRFTSLPQGIIPGQIVMRGMEMEKQQSSLPGSPAQGARNSPSLDMVRPPLPPPPPPPSVGSLPQVRPLSGPPPPPMMTHGPPITGALPTGPPPQVMPSLRPPPTHLPVGVLQLNLPPGMVRGHLPPPPHTQLPPRTQPPPLNQPTQPGSYRSQLPLPPTTTQPPLVPQPQHQRPPLQQLDVGTLLERLTSIGVIGSKPNPAARAKREDSDNKKKEEEEERAKDDLIPVELMFTSENLRKRRAWLVESLYRGMQCSSCGLRYPPEQTLQYSHHLDWHFRQNIKQQESTKKANVRKFYFSIEDWLQYEEIEDVEERVPSMFEAEGIEEAMEAEDTEEPSVAVSSDTSLGVCPVCHDTFSQFFHEEAEEWRYRNAMQMEGVNYHPACHHDLTRAEKAEQEKEEIEAGKKEKEEKKKEEKKEEEEKEEKEKEKEEGDDKGKEGVEGEKDKKEEGTSLEKEEEEAEKDKEKEGEALKETKDKEEKGPEDNNRVSGDALLPIRIKEEPMDVEEMNSDNLTTSMPPPATGMLVKKEVKDEPPDSPMEHQDGHLSPLPNNTNNNNDDDDDDEEDLFLNESNDDNLYEAPVIAVNNAETDIASSIDGNMELSSTSPPSVVPTINRIKLNISKPVVANVNNNSNINNNNNESSDKSDNHHHILNSSSIEEESDEFVPPPFTVDYKLKPAFRDVELEDMPVIFKGEEMSGLCSIM
ncbi:hypothetical protein Pmani_015799 [Petrolisthes manimaculis]|uniref:PCFS4-like zinc finger domain-containing protein n=1 Tax=Petrolisthes manimaculis TaxID=1843537 RepID=A0AAE1PTN2_9EUCA|nr:hypothetical protein Pmani_015799 [Petrolisthes manimaculis]